MQWSAALGAGLIVGGVFLVVPRGNPWSSFTFFSPLIMGRTVPSSFQVPLFAVWLIHMGVALVYGLIISRIVAGLTQLRAVISGGVIGLLLYLVNLLVISVVLPEMRGNESSVLFAHFVFGLVTAGAYRGLLKRKMKALPPGS